MSTFGNFTRIRRSMPCQLPHRITGMLLLPSRHCRQANTFRWRNHVVIIFSKEGNWLRQLININESCRTALNREVIPAQRAWLNCFTGVNWVNFIWQRACAINSATQLEKHLTDLYLPESIMTFGLVLHQRDPFP